MKDILNSFSEWYKEKSNSSFYAVYVATFVFWNWRMFYALFFENADLLKNTTRIAYAEKFSHHIDKLNTGIRLLDSSFVAHVTNEVVLFGVPALFTFLIILCLPWINNRAHAWELKFYFGRKELFDSANRRYQQEKTRHLRQFKNETVEQTKVLEEIISESARKKEVEQKVASNPVSQEVLWSKEYEELKKSPRFRVLGSVNSLIYRYEGHALDDYNGLQIDTNDLAYADTSGLVKLQKGGGGVYELTEKGRYFLKEFLLKN